MDAHEAMTILTREIGSRVPPLELLYFLRERANAGVTGPFAVEPEQRQAARVIARWILSSYTPHPDNVALAEDILIDTADRYSGNEADLARAVLAAVLPAHDRRVRAEALREAADDWPNPGCNCFTDQWLRDRAAAEETP